MGEPMKHNRILVSSGKASDPVRQRGASLFVSMIILIAVTLLTLASLGAGMMELRMSSNEELRMAAVQAAQAAVDNVIQTDYQARQPASLNYSLQYFTVKGNIPDRVCTSSWNGSECTTKTITLSAPLNANGSGAQLKITRWTDPQSTRTGCGKAALFEIESISDRTLIGQGKAELVHGYLACDYLASGSSTAGLPVQTSQN
jgi:hypothetical protein